jgi:hypothetical protein
MQFRVNLHQDQARVDLPDPEVAITQRQLEDTYR